jgi:hypothetical protein
MTDTTATTVVLPEADSAPAVRTLVLSWSGVLSQLFHGLVSLEELDGALFYFGCTRDHAFAPETHDGYNQLDSIISSDPARGRRLHAFLMEIVASSELAGRVTWRALDESSSYGQLNELLERNGLPVIKLPASEVYGYYYAAVHRAVEEQDLSYNVISIASERR